VNGGKSWEERGRLRRQERRMKQEKMRRRPLKLGLARA